MKADLHNNLKVARAISPVAITTGNATLTSEIIDGADYESVEFIVASGAITDGTFTVTMYADDASDMSGEAAVGADDLLIASGTTLVFAATADNVVKKMGYRGGKRYLRIKAVQSGATTGGFLTAVAVLGHPRIAPVA